jgi:hypothetical protein
MPMKQQSIRYKTYLKEAIVEAISAVFANHPDRLLRETKVSVDWPLERTDFPSVVIRFHERRPRNAGVGHEEWREVYDTLTRTPVYSNIFTDDNTFRDLTDSPTLNITDSVESIVRIHWNAGDPAHIGQLVRADKIDGFGIYCVASLNETPGSLALSIYLRRGTDGDVLAHRIIVPTPVWDHDYWVVTRVVGDSISFGFYNLNPLSGNGPLHQANYTMTSTELGDLTDKGKAFLDTSTSVASTSTITQYAVNSIAATFARSFRRFKHLLYTGDLEFTILALSTLDRDLISDSIVEILMLGDLQPWTNQWLTRVYRPDPNLEPASVEHFININTDTLEPSGESQAPVPWEAEDQLIYTVSYRTNVLGELYSRAPSQEVFGFVERVETYPYDPWVGEPVPNPHPEDPEPWS